MSILFQICMQYTCRTTHRGGNWGILPRAPAWKGPQEAPLNGPLNTCLKDWYTLIEQSDLNTLIEQSQYSSEQYSKLIDKEIWLMMGSYRHCQQVVTFIIFFWSSPYNLGQGPHFNSLPWALVFLWAALYTRGVRHWQEYRRTSELKYGIWNIFKSYFRICTCIFVYCSYHVI